ncbi:MAG: ATP-binding protein [Planctomycetota bacterium]
MESVQETLNLNADRAELSKLRSSLQLRCQEAGIRPKTTRRIVLAIDEAAANVMEHGNLGPSDPVQVELEIEGDGIQVIIRDRGKSFDPSAQSPGESKSFAPGQKRGFGLYLLHLITDSVDYERTPDGENVLTLRITGP